MHGDVTRCLPRAVILSAIVVALVGCGDATSGPRLTPEGPHASLGLNAAVQATTATGVEIRAGYLRSGGQRVELAAQTFPLDANATQQGTMPVPLGACLSDTQRAVPGPSCEIALQVRLMRTSTLLDQQTVAVSVRPGEAKVVQTPVALYEAQTVRIATSGAPTGTATTTASMEVGDTVRLSGTAVDASGAAVSGRTIQWTSSNAAVARVEASAGLVTGVSAGTATIQATGGTKSAGQVLVTVTPTSVRTLASVPTSLQLIAGSSSTLQVTARDVRGAVLTGRLITFASSNTVVATVSSTGIVQGLTAGTATITASNNEGPNGTTIRTTIPVVVTAPAKLTATPTTATFAIRVGTNPLPIDIAINSDVVGATISGLTTNVAYGSGASGWLSATVTQTSTPASLHLVATVGSLPTGVYAALVTVRSTSPVSTVDVPVTLTITTATPVDCSQTNSSQFFPPTSTKFVSPNGANYNGGTGTFFLPVALGTAAQTIRVTWDMQVVPDALTVCFRGIALFDTGGFVSGTGSYSFTYPGSAGTSKTDLSQSMYLYLAVRGNTGGGTAWDVWVYGNYVAPSYPVPIVAPDIRWPGDKPFTELPSTRAMPNR